MAPALVSAALSGSTLTLVAYETNGPSTNQTLEIYLRRQSTERSFQISTSVPLSSNAMLPTTVT